MMDSMNWGYIPEYRGQTMVAHFDKDDEHCTLFQDQARKLGKQVIVKQCAGREGLTVIVPKISFDELNLLVDDTNN